MTDNLHIPDPGEVLLIHASAVSVDGGALIFLGPSGAGKSTICRLLSTCGQPLDDDRLYLVPRVDGRWEVAGVNNISLHELKTIVLHSVPLRAIFRIYQAPAPSLKQIDELQTCHYLTDALFEVGRHRHWHDDIETKQLAFSRLAAIARSVPGYKFYFNHSSRTLEVINKEIDLWNNPAEMWLTQEI